MRYIKTFVQENRRYSEEISEKQYKFYTSPNYQAGDDSHKIFVLQEEDDPVFEPQTQFIEKELIVDDEGAIERKHVRNKSTEQINSEKVAQAEAARKEAENNAVVAFREKQFKASDKEVNILSAYIQAGTESVPWKTVDGSWVILNNEDFPQLLNLIAQKKKEIFEQEYMETI
jgi:hypothetical protein